MQWKQIWCNAIEYGTDSLLYFFGSDRQPCSSLFYASDLRSVVIRHILVAAVVTRAWEEKSGYIQNIGLKFYYDVWPGMVTHTQN